jgi:hypothetical protein
MLLSSIHTYLAKCYLHTRKNAQVDAINTDENRIEQCFAAHIVHSCQQYWTILLHPIQAQQHCSILLTSVNNVGSKTLFSPVEQRARHFLPCRLFIFTTIVITFLAVFILTHHVNFPWGRKPEHPEKTYNFRQSVDWLFSHESVARIEPTISEVKGACSDNCATKAPLIVSYIHHIWG